MEVGLREFKNGLSRYIRRVRDGETIVVTDRGEPVARVIPAGIPPDLAKLVAEGRLTWSGKKFRPPKKRIKLGPGPSASDYIIEDRF